MIEDNLRSFDLRLKLEIDFKTLAQNELFFSQAYHSKNSIFRHLSYRRQACVWFFWIIGSHFHSKFSKVYNSDMNLWKGSNWNAIFRIGSWQTTSLKIRKFTFGTTYHWCRSVITLFAFPSSEENFSSLRLSFFLGTALHVRLLYNYYYEHCVSNFGRLRRQLSSTIHWESRIFLKISQAVPTTYVKVSK